MVDVAWFRPIEAQIWLRGTSIRAVPAVEATTDPVLAEEGTTRDDFNAERIRPFSRNLAEVRRFPRSDQRFEHRVLRTAKDLNLKIAAARGADLVISGAAPRGGAGVVTCENWESAPGVRQVSRLQSAPLYHGESAATELPLRSRSFGRAGPSGEAVCVALHSRPAEFGEAAGDGYVGGTSKLGAVECQGTEINPFRVTQEPGGLVVGRLRSTIQTGAPKGHFQPVTLGANLAAGGGIHHARNLGPGSVGTSALYL